MHVKDSHCVFEGKRRCGNGCSHQRSSTHQSNCTVPALRSHWQWSTIFFPSASRRLVPTSDCCKELTVKLTSFFFSLPVLYYLFFLTPVTKYSGSFRKVQEGTKVRIVQIGVGIG